MNIKDVKAILDNGIAYSLFDPIKMGGKSLWMMKNDTGNVAVYSQTKTGWELAIHYKESYKPEGEEDCPFIGGPCSLWTHSGTHSGYASREEIIQIMEEWFLRDEIREDLGYFGADPEKAEQWIKEGR